MTEPIRRACRTLDDLPTVPEIERMVTDEDHLVLQFGPSPDGPGLDPEAIIRLIAPHLPDFSVFNNGGGVTVKKVIAERVVLAHADAIVGAAAQFRHTATDLMGRLSRKLDIPLEAFAAMQYRPMVNRRWRRSREHGTVGSGWHYAFHGRECGFKNRPTGQVLDVVLGFPGEFGVLDPYFFGNYIHTTPDLAPLARLFPDRFHDPWRAMEILERLGLLRAIIDPTTGHPFLAAPGP